ncbi:MAG TPA: dienelactone hydrolase family protein [Myxococcales bacterium]|nr:dienelactone hydrolase family protein [Myxococcales bacterium]
MHKLITSALLAASVLAAGSASAEVQTKEITYQQGKTQLQGFIAWDDAVKGKRPGVLVIHEWWGHNQHARNQALRLAKAGYVGFALDMYGKGKLAEHPKDAQAMSGELMKDPKAVKARFDAALAELKKDPNVDPRRIGVVGYCMGGSIALEMARQGENVQAVATFHAGLSAPDKPAAKGSVKPRILVNTGGADPFVPQAAVDALKKEMADAGARAEVISYPGAKHGFTNPDAGKHGMDALAYNAEADQASWEASMKMFKEVFGS